jgi:flagellar biogenesis protein FliO
MGFPRIMGGIAVLGAVVRPEAAWAAGAAAAVSGGAAPDLFGAGVKMFAALLILMGGLLLALRLLKRLGLLQGALTGGPEVIRVLATRHLSPKSAVTVVEVGGRVLTLGVTGERIACLDKMPLSEFQQSRPPKEPEVEAEAGGGFSRRLKALAGASPFPGMKSSHDPKS